MARRDGLPGLDLARQGDAEWCVDTAWRGDLLGQAAPDWFTLIRDDRAAPIKSGHHRETWRVELQGRAVYAKVHDASGVLDAWRDRLVGSRGEREWQALRRALHLGVHVPRAVGVGVQGGRRAQSVVLAEELTGARPLAAVWMNEMPSLAAGNQRRAAVAVGKAVAKLFAVAHDRGFLHRDAHPDNVLICGHPAENPQAVFADVYAARFKRRPIARRSAVRSLAQLAHFFRGCTSLTTRMRFLKEYLRKRETCGVGTPGRQTIRTNWKELADAARVHAATLAAQRDRRLRRSGKYFATVPLAGGWTATVCLALERRHRFAERTVPDRTVAQWHALLPPLLAAALRSDAAFQSNGTPHERRNDAHDTVDGTVKTAELCTEVDRLATWRRRGLAALTTSQHRRAFLHCHQLRHRDVAADLIIGVAEHRTLGLIDATVLIRPMNAGD